MQEEESTFSDSKGSELIDMRRVATARTRPREDKACAVSSEDSDDKSMCARCVGLDFWMCNCHSQVVCDVHLLFSSVLCLSACHILHE